MTATDLLGGFVIVIMGGVTMRKARWLAERQVRWQRVVLRSEPTPTSSDRWGRAYRLTGATLVALGIVVAIAGVAS